MQRVIMIIAGLISIGSGLLKIRDVRRQPDAPSLKALCLGLLAFGSAFLILAPPHTIIVSELLHMPNSGRLLGNVLTLASAGAIQVMMLYLAHPVSVARPRVRRRLALLTAIALSMTALLAVADTENETNFVERYATYTPITVYQVLYLSCLGAAVVDLIQLSVRYSRHVGATLKIGLRMVAAGGVVYAFHTAYKIILIAAAWMSWSVPGDESAIATALAASGGVLIASGATLPVWWPRAVLPWQWLSQYRSYRRLEPLWSELSSAVPEIMLSCANGAEGGSRPWEMGVRLYRRVIEIRDAQLVLDPFGDPRVSVQAEATARDRGLTGERMQAYVDATRLANALARRGAAPLSKPVTVSPRKGVGDASLRTESRYLEQVAAAFTALPNATSAGSVGPT
jgi:hypothetical protein